MKVERDQALKELQQRIKNGNLLKHMYAVEAVLVALARHFGEDEDKWALAGLLHDIDYEETAADPESHSIVGAGILEDLGLPADIVYAVKAHNPAHCLTRRSLLDSALHIVDPLTGLIVAAALIHPQKKLAPLDGQFILKRYGERQFARGASRGQIALCREELGLSLEELIDIALRAMQAIAEDLGL